MGPEPTKEQIIEKLMEENAELKSMLARPVIAWLAREHRDLRLALERSLDAVKRGFGGDERLEVISFCEYVLGDPPKDQEHALRIVAEAKS